METKENIMEESLQEMKNIVAERTKNYQQAQIDGEEQTVIFNHQGPPLDPEDEQFDDEEENDEDFPAKEDLEDDDFDLDPDADDDFDEADEFN